jgi:hypothetical protein
MTYAQKGPIPTEQFSRDHDSSKVQKVTNSNFYVYCGIAAIVFFALFIVWALVS